MMNPLVHWREYLACRTTGDPIPDEVLEYFDSVAKVLIHREWGDLPDKNQKIAAEALGLAVGPGQTTPFKHDEMVRREIMLTFWWKAYQAGKLDAEYADFVSTVFGQRYDRAIEDKDEFYVWAAELFGVDSSIIEKIVSRIK